jgi:hypothetical protein
MSPTLPQKTRKGAGIKPISLSISHPFMSPPFRKKRGKGPESNPYHFRYPTPSCPPPFRKKRGKGGPPLHRSTTFFMKSPGNFKSFFLIYLMPESNPISLSISPPLHVPTLPQKTRKGAGIKTHITFDIPPLHVPHPSAKNAERVGHPAPTQPPPSRQKTWKGATQRSSLDFRGKRVQCGKGWGAGLVILQSGQHLAQGLHDQLRLVKMDPVCAVAGD